MAKLLEILEQTYGVNFLSVTPYVPKNPKYSNSEHFWVAVCSVGTYFIKKHSVSALHSIDRELEVLRLVQQYISVPEIFFTKNGYASMEFNGNSYVLYRYIDGLNLRERGVGTYEYFDILCNLQNQLIENGRSGKLYDIEQQIEKAEKTFHDIKVEVEKSAGDLAVHDLGYIDFLLIELANLKKETHPYSVPSCLVHGDLLKQNIIVTEETTWVIDWEKAVDYIVVIDLLRSVLFTMIDSSKSDLGLHEDVLVEYLLYCFKKVELDPVEVKHSLGLFYIHLVTNIDYLSSVYLYGREPVAGRTKEDYFICQWFKEHKDIIQLRINNHLTVM